VHRTVTAMVASPVEDGGVGHQTDETTKNFWSAVLMKTKSWSVSRDLLLAAGDDRWPISQSPWVDANRGPMLNRNSVHVCIYMHVWWAVFVQFILVRQPHCLPVHNTGHPVSTEPYRLEVSRPVKLCSYQFNGHKSKQGLQAQNKLEMDLWTNCWPMKTISINMSR